MDGWVLDRLGQLFSYPDEEHAQSAERLLERLGEVEPSVCEELRPLVAWMRQARVEEMQEHYTREFDMNPATCLDVGWHVHADSYARGELLVRMRRLIRQAGLMESYELPDHLSHVLPVLARIGQAEADEIVTSAVLPALDKILEAAPAASPTRALLSTTRRLLATEHGTVAPRRGLPRVAALAPKGGAHA